MLSNIGCKIDKNVYEKDTLFIRIDENRYVYKVNTADEYYTLEEEEIQIDTILYYSR